VSAEHGLNLWPEKIHIFVAVSGQQVTFKKFDDGLRPKTGFLGQFALRARQGGFFVAIQGAGGNFQKVFFNGIAILFD